MMGGFGMGFGWIFGLLILFLIGWFFMKGFNPGSTSTGTSLVQRETESALDILKKRYARGEISKDEYEQMKKDLLS